MTKRVYATRNENALEHLRRRRCRVHTRKFDWRYQYVHPSACENSRHDGIGALEIVNQHERTSSQARLFVPLKRTDLPGEASNPLATMRRLSLSPRGLAGRCADLYIATHLLYQ